MLNGVPVTALGTMSGTSLDGVDAAVIDTDGVEIFDFGPVAYRPYSDTEQAVLRAHLGLWPDADTGAAADVVEQAHIAVMRDFSDIAVAGFHGQTLAHDPAGGRTHQCGDGGTLAVALGCPVVWDFRSADVAAGGQGAPLAPFFHFALAKWIGARRPVAFLNLGGVGNLTWVDPARADPADAGALLAFDTGPANAPINDVMRARFGLPFDAAGQVAATGTPDTGVLSGFAADPYFSQRPPKSLDRDHFGGLVRAVAGLGDADAIATLTQAVVWSVIHALAQCPRPPDRLLVTGGGRHNATLMAGLAAGFAGQIAPVEAVGLDGDMLEAQAFAYLAVRVLRGLPTSAQGTTGVPVPVCGGRIALPAN